MYNCTVSWRRVGRNKPKSSGPFENIIGRENCKIKLFFMQLNNYALSSVFYLLSFYVCSINFEV